MITRRRLLQCTAAATVVVAASGTACTAAPSRADGKPVRPHRSAKFSGDGRYLFDFGSGRPIEVQHVAYDGCQFLELSDGPGTPVRFGFSFTAFDRYCVRREVA